jgi:hypothetical protein
MRTEEIKDNLNRIATAEGKLRSFMDTMTLSTFFNPEEAPSGFEWKGKALALKPGYYWPSEKERREADLRGYAPRPKLRGKIRKATKTTPTKRGPKAWAPPTKSPSTRGRK